ncbi:MAG: hypothetical protein AAF318_19980 [Pseudomonadota bacterium]
MSASEERRCGTCRYFDEVDGPRGRCRRALPKDIAVDGEVVTRWPIVIGDRDWCGEHLSHPRPYNHVVFAK